DGQGADIQPVAMTTDTIVEDVAPLQPRRQRKRKTVVADAGGPSHPPKKLREDYGALGGASTAATQEREDKSHADSITGLNLRTIGALQREKRKLRAVVDEQAELLKAKDGEIESLKAQLLLKEAEAAKAIYLRAEYGMELAVVKCLNSIDYLSALGAAISKAVEKGMQEGLSAGITHGAEGRQLADVATYNPSAEAGYLSALQHLQNVNFPLIAELKSNKDASLMVPIHHSLDQRVVGASALSLSLEVSHSRVKKMRENIAKHVLVLRGVFVPLSEPLSAAALKGMEGPSGPTPDATTTLSTTFISASTIPPISTDDYEVAHEDGQGVPV
nr:hypothetical protein [Tanacetum cinerariifolium]